MLASVLVGFLFFAAFAAGFLCGVVVKDSYTQSSQENQGSKKLRVSSIKSEGPNNEKAHYYRKPSYMREKHEEIYGGPVNE